MNESNSIAACRMIDTPWPGGEKFFFEQSPPRIEVRSLLFEDIEMVYNRGRRNRIRFTQPHQSWESLDQFQYFPVFQRRMAREEGSGFRGQKRRGKSCISDPLSPSAGQTGKY